MDRHNQEFQKKLFVLKYVKGKKYLKRIYKFIILKTQSFNPVMRIHPAYSQFNYMESFLLTRCCLVEVAIVVVAIVAGDCPKFCTNNGPQYVNTTNTEVLKFINGTNSLLLANM